MRTWAVINNYTPSRVGTQPSRSNKRPDSTQMSCESDHAFQAVYARQARQWSGQPDLNRRPPLPQSGALPDCAMSRKPSTCYEKGNVRFCSLTASVGLPCKFSENLSFQAPSVSVKPPSVSSYLQFFFISYKLRSYCFRSGERCSSESRTPIIPGRWIIPFHYWCSVFSFVVSGRGSGLPNSLPPQASIRLTSGRRLPIFGRSPPSGREVAVPVPNTGKTTWPIRLRHSWIPVLS